MELDGVSASLASCSGVTAAVAVLVDQKLYAFLRPATCCSDQIITAMKPKQPYYAIPEKCYPLDDFPKTSNGKIDKRALAALARSLTAPPTQLQESATVVTVPKVISKVDSAVALSTEGKSLLQAPVETRGSPEALSQAETIVVLPAADDKPVEKRATDNLTTVKVLSQTETTIVLPDEEKVADKSASATATDKSIPVENLEKVPALPHKSWPKWARHLRLRALIVYRTLFSLVWLLNLVALLCIVILDADTVWVARMAYVNLTLGVLMRQDHVINLMYTIFCSLPRTWPLFLRKRAAKIYHLGGAHSGATSAAVLWFVASLILGSWAHENRSIGFAGRPSLQRLVVSWLTVSLLLMILAAAYPTFRKQHHDVFEVVHRFIGWTSLGFFWIATILSVDDSHRNLEVASQDAADADAAAAASPPSFGMLILTCPEFWLLTVITCSIALSWITLKKVPVESEVLSEHAVRLHFQFVVPVNGSFVRLSNRPLVEWHSFATIPEPDAVDGRRPGFSFVVSNAGDWTKDMIQRPKTSIWVRGVPSKYLLH